MKLLVLIVSFFSLLSLAQAEREKVDIFSFNNEVPLVRTLPLDLQSIGSVAQYGQPLIYPVGALVRKALENDEDYEGLDIRFFKLDSVKLKAKSLAGKSTASFILGKDRFRHVLSETVPVSYVPATADEPIVPQGLENVGKIEGIPFKGLEAWISDDPATFTGNTIAWDLADYGTNGFIEDRPWRIRFDGNVKVQETEFQIQVSRNIYRGEKTTIVNGAAMHTEIYGDNNGKRINIKSPLGDISRLTGIRAKSFRLQAVRVLAKREGVDGRNAKVSLQINDRAITGARQSRFRPQEIPVDRRGDFSANRGYSNINIPQDFMEGGGVNSYATGAGNSNNTWHLAFQGRDRVKVKKVIIVVREAEPIADNPR